MKKLFKKATALFLAMSMLLGMSSMAYAEDKTEENVDYEAIVKDYIENAEIPEDMTREEAEAALNDIIAYIDANGAAILAEAYQYALENGYIDEFKALVAELEAAVKAEAEVLIPALKAELEALKEELKTATGEAKAELEAKIAELEAKIAEIEAKIAEVKAAVKALNNAIKDFAYAVEAGIENGITAAVEEIQKAVDAVKEAVKVVKTTVAELVELMETVQGTVVEINAKVEAVIAAYEGTFAGEYALDEDSYYVAFGDTVASEQVWEETYGWYVADAYGIDYTNYAMPGLSVAGLLEALEDEDVAAEVEAADLITVGFSVKGIAESALVTEEVDWVQYFGEEGAAYVEEAIAKAVEELTAGGLSEDMAGMLLSIVEVFPYAVVEYAANYHKVAAEIHEINPEALVVLVGMYNPLEGFVFENEGEEVAVGEYMDKLIDISNAHLRACAMLSENTIFVEAEEVETILDAEYEEELTVLEYLLELLDMEAVALHPSENGHLYIANQILGAIEVVEPEEEPGLLGDVNLDGVIDTTDAQAIFNYFMGISVEGQTFALDNADINGDGYIDTSDAQAAFNIFMGI